MSSNKSFSTETSERYALALFELSRENSELDIIEKNVSDFLELYSSSKELENFVKNPTQLYINQITVIKEISKRTPQLIEGAPKSFKQNYQLILEAVTANPRAFEFLNTYISKDAELMIEAVRKNQKCSKYISRISKKTLSKLNILDRAWLKKMETTNA